ARVMAEGVIEQATAQDDAMLLRQVSMALRSPGAKDEKALALLSAKAAEAVVQLSGDKDAAALVGASEAYSAAGDAAKAKELARKAIAAAEAALAAEGEKKTSRTLLQLAEAYFAAGDTAKAKELGQKAVEAAPDQQKESI